MRKWLLFSTLFLILVSGCQNRKVTSLVEVNQNSIDASQESNVSETQSTQPKPTQSTDSTELINETPPSVAETVPSENTNDSSDTEKIPPAASSDDKENQPTVQENSKTSNAQDQIIIAKSEDLEDIDERTLILNEIDDLLDSTLGSLDELEADTLLDDNIVKEGGLE